MVNKILLATAVADILFLITGAAQLAFALIVKNVMNEESVEGMQAARNLLYQRFPLQAGIINAIIIFVTFVITLPGLITPARSWLKLSGILITVCGLFTLCIGIFLWILTLRTKEDFLAIWIAQPPAVQDLMQTAFECCGYFNSTSPAFVTNPSCPSPAAAALMRGCSAPVGSFANIFIDDVFTAVFGMVGVDALLILCIACLLKDRKERERYRHIDEKTGYTGI